MPQLSSSQIAFLDSTRILLALSPHLLCFHLSTNSNKQVTRWTKGRCLDFRRKSWGRFLKSTAGILAGKNSLEIDYDTTDEEDDSTDDFLGEGGIAATAAAAGISEEEESMPSTAALTILHDRSLLQTNTHTMYDSDSDPSDNSDSDSDDAIPYQPRPTAIAAISLHSDGTVRIWSLPTVRLNQALTPLRVRLLRSLEDGRRRTDDVPMPHAWSSSNENSVSMVTTTYGDNKRFVLCVCIPTTDGLSSVDVVDVVDAGDKEKKEGGGGNNGTTAVNELKSPCHMLLYDGDVSVTTNTTTVDSSLSSSSSSSSSDTNRFVAMYVPSNVESLSSMQFVTTNHNSNTWELTALYETVSRRGGRRGRGYSLLRDRTGPRNTALVFYRSGSFRRRFEIGSIAGDGHPQQQQQQQHTFDSVAEMERMILSRDCSVFLDSFVLSGRIDESDSDEQHEEKGIRRIDAWYMKRLFRPASVRTMDGRRPSDASIRRAMNKVYPSRRFGGPRQQNSDIYSIETETVLTIKEWTKMDETKALTESRWRRTGAARVKSLPSTPAPASNGKPARTPSIYHAFRTSASVRNTTDDDAEDETMEEERPIKDSGNNNDDDREGKLEQRIVRYHERWRTFLLAVWDEEAKLRLPLALATVPKRDDDSGGREGFTTVVLLRAGATSTFLRSSPLAEDPLVAPSLSLAATLDSIALSILDRIYNSPSLSIQGQLAEVELQIWDLVSTAKLSLPTGKSAIDALVEDGSLKELSESAFASEEVRNRLSEIFRDPSSLGEGDIEGWLKTPLSTTLGMQLESQKMVGPGLPCVADESVAGEFLFSTGTDSNLARCATAVTLQYTESIRRLALARCLLIIGMSNTVSNGDRFYGFGRNRVNDSLWTYLHVTSVIWLNAQMVATTIDDSSVGHIVGVQGEKGSNVPTPDSRSNDKSTDDVDMARSPSPTTERPRTRRKHVDMGYSWKEMALYYKLLEIAKREKRNLFQSNSSSCSVVRLAQTYVSYVFDKTPSDQDYMDDDTDNNAEEKVEEKENSFIELRALPDGIVEKSTYALRLLAPSISHPPVADDDNLYCRHEAVAEYLFTELHGSDRHSERCLSKATELWNRASMLLASRGPHLESSMPNDMKLLIESLSDIPNIAGGHQAPILSDGEHETMLAQMLQHIVDPNTTSIQDEVLQLSKMQTIKKLFLPWILTSQIVNARAIDLIIDHLLKWTADPEHILQHFLFVSLRISNLMRRVSVLESHRLTSFGTGMMKDVGAMLIISAINDIINTIEAQFTSNVHDGFMFENAALWSKSFRHAILGCRWDDAFKACLSNPDKERRVKNFERMVLVMVEAGELGALIKKITYTVVNTQSGSTDEEYKTGGEIDLYELAVETLADAAYQQSAHDMSQLPVNPQPKVDYMGCLYSLHVASGNWRRCCHAMDYYGNLKLSHHVLKTSTPDESSFPGLTSDKEKELGLKLVDDISLSALACAQLIQLVESKSHRYIVSGELSSQPALISYKDSDTADKSSAIQRLTKRSLGGDGTLSSMSSDESEEANDHLGRLSRLYTENDLAIRSARMAAVKTLYMDALSTDSLLDIFQSSHPEIMDSLSQLGYYSQAISLAYSKREAKNGARPGGRDILIDAVSYISCQYIAPSTVRLSRPTPLNPNFNDTNNSTEAKELQNDALEARPTLDQLRSMPMGFATLSGHESWRSRVQADGIIRGKALMELLRKLTLYYSSSSNSFAVELAGTLLDLDSGLAELPLWLIDILLGNNDELDGEGLFARSKMSIGSNGSDPAALTRLLMARGLYVQACTGVCSVLLRGNSANKRTMTSRLPEKGHIDYIPYDTIDTLWSYIQDESSSPDCKPERKRSILRARAQMEAALKKHFELMKISEIGMLSARALATC